MPALTGHRLSLRAYAVATVTTAAAAVLLFGTAHAIIIVPIWSRLGSGFPFALASASAVGWAYHELLGRGRLRLRLRDGLVFGAGLWLLLLPPTVVGMIARFTPVHTRAESVEMAAVVVAAVVGGGTLGWRLAGRRGALSGAVAAVALTATVGGPLPLSAGFRGVALWVALLPTLGVTGALQALLLRALARGAGDT